MEAELERAKRQPIAVLQLGRLYSFIRDLQLWTQAKPAHCNCRVLHENVGVRFGK
jgi:hypothetical protein